MPAFPLPIGTFAELAFAALVVATVLVLSSAPTRRRPAGTVPWSLQWLDGTTYELRYSGAEPARQVRAEVEGHLVSGGLGPWDRILPFRPVRVCVMVPTTAPAPSLTLRWHDRRGRARRWSTTLPGASPRPGRTTAVG